MSSDHQLRAVRKSGSFDPVSDFVSGYSIEVTPVTLARQANFETTLPVGTRVYIAHIDGTPISEMIAAARRIREAGYVPMPHLPARSVPDRITLDVWLQSYRDEADVSEALVIAGGRDKPIGDFADSMSLIETGLFDANGFGRLHFAGHPEGNRDIDPDGGKRQLDAALAWKQAFSVRSDAEVALVTQFIFDAVPVLSWAEGLAEAGIDLPVHIGLAGPAKLQTLIKYAVACGVGASLKVLQKRARDLTQLLRPYTPKDVVQQLAQGAQTAPTARIAGVHFFPFGGVAATAEWCRDVHVSGNR